MKMRLVKTGWLAKDSTFPKGRVANFVLPKLKALLLRERVNLLRHVKPCPLCPDQSWQYADGQERMVLGCSQILIPCSEHVAWSAPDMIIHYIEVHQYQPPLAFLDALQQFDPDSTWSGVNFFKSVASRNTDE